MKLSPSQFRRAFNRFQNIHTMRSGGPLDRFTDPQSFVQEWEGYKIAIPFRAMTIMKPKRWTRKMIGNGEILSSVIQAIELPGNNLLHWEARKGPASRVHLRLIEAQNESEACRELEAIFFDLYKKGLANQTIFESLIQHCGKRYELLGYLFFVADPGKFLPVRTKTFDKALAELGVNHRTQGQCGWENYQDFLTAMREVQSHLHSEGLQDATLLDAHSFCWILARLEVGDKSRPIQPAVIQHFGGTLHLAADKGGKFTLKDDANTRDIQEELHKRQASGRIAEEIALVAERERLLKEGRSDLADKVEDITDRPGLGYDIKSFEVDGSDRFIEVKNVTKSNRFFLSEWEWLNSRERPNYCFYLVSGVEKKRPRVSILPATDLKQVHLRPVQYLVRFDS